jgi:hypothetical protein
MRAGLTVSVVGHAALLAWGIVSLPSPNSLDANHIESIPIDFVQLDELTRLNLGVSTAEAREEIVPEPPAPKVAELPPPKLPPPPEPEPAPPEPEQALAPPEPPPPPPEPEPEPSEPEALPEPAVAPDPEPPPPPPEQAARPNVPAPIPRARPAPPKRTVVAKAETKETFNTDEISALLDKSTPTGSTQPETPPTLGSSTGSIVDTMTMNELDALRARLAQCWNIQLAPPDLSELRVKVKMYLNQDGSLAQSPEVLEAGSTDFARSAADSALRAVRRCAPYNLPAEKYDSWREINVTFDPREMFGG